jgi:predicted nucleic acid-binding protein
MTATRFIDASVFIYAYIKPRKPLAPEILKLKNGAQSIVKRINEGEPVTTSLIHISEIANILEARMPLKKSLEILTDLMTTENLKIMQPTVELYQSAIEEAKIVNVGVNDALAYLLMKEKGIAEVYSFDLDFDRIKGITRLTH